MWSRLCIITSLLTVLVLPSRSAVGNSRWDVGFNGGWMRVLIDVDTQQQALTAKVYQAAPGGNSILIENLVLIQSPENYLMQGTVTSGTFKVGLGKVQFTVGDHFYLWVSRYTGDVMLVLVGDKVSWYTTLSWF